MLSSILKKKIENRIVLSYKDLKYNPCNDVIFPSVIKVPEHIEKPLGKYYMYYAPHSNPGGICLAYSNDLNGEWIEYTENPIITNKWSDKYDVEHVSSPHVIYIEEKKQFFLYFHGDNEQTRYAYSSNGIAFDYGGIVLDTEILSQFSGLSYARTFKLNKPENIYKYVMFYLGYTYIEDLWSEFKSFGLYRALSKNCIDWEYEDKPIISQNDIEKGEFVCSPFYLSVDNKSYLLFHKDKGVNGSIYYIEMNSKFEKIGDIKLLCSYNEVFDKEFRISDPDIIIENDIVYMFVATGRRLNQNIGLIKYEV